MEQNPITFLSQEDPDNRLLVIIKNKDIAGHVHKVVNSCKVLTDSALIQASFFLRHRALLHVSEPAAS